MIYFILYLFGGLATNIATDLSLKKHGDKLSVSESVALFLLWPAYLAAFFIYYLFGKV